MKKVYTQSKVEHMTDDAFIYCRISNDRTGEKAGVTRQETDCRAYAKQHNLNVLEVFTDNDVSAITGDRVAYRTMWERLARHEAQHVIVWASDRLYRRTIDLEQLVSVIEHTRTTLHTVTSGNIDLTTPQGRMIARQLATVATYEVEHTAERITAAHRHIRGQGRWTGGKPPTGYLNGGPAGLIPDPDRAPLIQEAAQWLLNGNALFSIAKRFTAEGHRTVHGGTITANVLARALRTPTVAGIVSHNGKEIGPAQWEPLISVEDYRTIQDILRDPTRRTTQSNERQWQGSGIYRCGECGSPLNTNKTNRNGKGRGYVCRECLKITRNQEKVDELISSLICAYLETQELKPVSQNDNSQELVTERNRLSARLTSLTTMFTDDQINEIQLASGTKEINQKIKRIDQQLAAIREDNPITDLMLTGGNLRKVWDQKPADVRARIIDALMTVTILPVEKRGPGFDPSRIKIEWK